MKPIRISVTSMEEFETIFDDSLHGLNWDNLFVLPFWLKIWWQVFGTDKCQKILAVWSGTSLLGIAPLMLERHTARFIGSESVCDYQDMIMANQDSNAFFSHLLDYLKQTEVKWLELSALRQDSMMLQGLSKIAEKQGYNLICEPVDRFYELKLPKTWEGYLKILDGKQRHEVRRKIRRLNEAGRARFHVIDNRDSVEDIFDDFLSLFQASRKDKAQFLNDRMKTFFRSLVEAMADRDMLQLGFLRIDGKDAASTLSFEYANKVFLYNSGYHPKFSALSVGVLCKVFSIKHSIEKKMACYDFLKGDEVYKQRLGGRPVQLYRLAINLEK